MPDGKTFATYEPGRHLLPDLAIQLLDEQKKSWRQLAAGYSSLGSAQLREVQCTGFSVQLQWNRARIVSTGAKVDEKSIRERKCFLCVENLPEDQQGVLYQEKYLVLCNPAPIFAGHFTISHIQHIPQDIESSAGDFLDLARDLSPKFSVFYNGPRCGASAPDHLHFQASPRNAIPVEVEAVDARRREILKKSPSLALVGLKQYGRSVLVIESIDRESLSGFLSKLLGAWKGFLGSSDEPMMNMICAFREMVWRVILFPRVKHRPDAYYKEGEEKILISPAAVDMGGLVITPVEKDFRGVDAKMIEAIFGEISLDQKTVEEIISRM